MTQFVIYATLLIVVVAAFLLPPLWLGLRRNETKASRKEANLAVFRDQLSELERERTEGTLADADFDQARRELQRRLLEEVAPEAEEAGKTTYGPSRKMAIVLLLLLPVLALAAYGILGNPKALDPAQTAAAPKMTAEQISGMVAKLAERMQANPDDMQGWLMLARSYKTMGRYEEAAAAYAKAEKVIDDDPELLASYAETFAMASGKGLQGKPLASLLSSSQAKTTEADLHVLAPTQVRCAIGVSVVSWAIRTVTRMVRSRLDPPAP